MAYDEFTAQLVRENANLKADLLESERKLRDLCLAHGAALIRIHDIEKELEVYCGIAERLGAEKVIVQLTWLRDTLCSLEESVRLIRLSSAPSAHTRSS